MQSCDLYSGRSCFNDPKNNPIRQLGPTLTTYHHHNLRKPSILSPFCCGFRDCHRSEKPIWVTGPGCDLATRGKPLPMTWVATGFSLSCQLLPIATSILRIPCRCFFPHQFHQLSPQQSPSLDRGIQDLQPCSPCFGLRFGAAA